MRIAQAGLCAGHPEQLRQTGHKVTREPHTTDGGFFESAALAPDSNHIEITV